MVKARKGALRLWLVLSVLWMGFIAWRSDLACSFKAAIGVTAPWCQFPLVDPQDYYSALALRILGAPLVAGIFIVAAFWIVAGFKNRR
jgi:hypothetical protein